MPPGVQNGAVNAQGVVRLRCLPMHFPGGIVGAAGVKECGRRSIRSVTFLVPLELDCHQDDGEIRQCLRDDNDGNDDNNNDNSSSPVDSTFEAVGQRNGAFLTASQAELTPHRTPGSSRESSPATGTNTQSNITTEGDTGTSHTPSLPLLPTSSVEQQPSTSEGRDAGAGESVTESRQPRRAALRQRKLMKSLLHDDLL